MSDALEENTRDKIYICLSDTINGKKILGRVAIFLIYQTMDEKGELFRAKWRWPEGNNLAKEIRVYILVSRVINGETWLYGLGGIGVSYHSDTPFERVAYGYTT